MMGHPWAALLVALLALPGAQSEDKEIASATSLGLEGCYRAGSWGYVRITLENRSTRSMEIEATLVARSGDRTFETRSLFSMGPGSRKTRFVYYHPDPGLSRVEAFIEKEGRRFQLPLADGRLMPVDTLVVVASPGETALDKTILRAYKKRGTPSFYSIRVSLPDLPDRRLGLDAVQTLVLPDGGVGLRIGQAEAIQHWVAAGGDLIIGGGRTPAEIGESPLLEMIPLLPQGATRLDSLPTTGKFLEKSIRGPLQVTTGRHLSGEVLRWEGEIPLIIQARYGQGKVTFLAFDPDALLGGKGETLPELWRFLIPLEGGDAERMPLSSTPAVRLIRNSVQKFTQGQPIPLVWIILFVLAYVVVIGPVDYIVLKRLGRLEWTWFTFTISVVVFSGLAYFGSVLLRGQDLAVREVTLLDIDPGTGWRKSSSFLGVYSPQNRRLDFRGLSDDTTLSPLRDPGSVYGGPTVVLEEPPVLLDTSPDVLIAPVRIWTPRSFRFQTCQEGKAPEVKVVVEMTLADVVLFNPFESELQDVILIQDDRIWKLGSILPGETGTWRETQYHADLDNWMATNDIKPSRGYGYYQGQQGQSLRNAALALTLLGAEATVQDQFPVPGGSPTARVTFADLSLRDWIDDGGAVLLGWLEDPPAAYTAEDWAPTREERIGLVRIRTESE